MALTTLTNLFGGIALLIILAIMALGKISIYAFGFSIKRLFIIGVLAYALTAFAFDFDLALVFVGFDFVALALVVLAFLGLAFVLVAVAFAALLVGLAFVAAPFLPPFKRQ